MLLPVESSVPVLSVLVEPSVPASSVLVEPLVPSVLDTLSESARETGETKEDVDEDGAGNISDIFNNF